MNLYMKVPKINFTKNWIYLINIKNNEIAINNNQV